LSEAFRSGEDVHLKTACEIFEAPPEKVDAEMRRRAKAVNFGIVYGQTAHGLSQTLGIPYNAAKEYIQRYFARYNGVAKWIEKNLDAARRDGCVRTILGRVRYLPDLAAKNTAVRQFNERAATNTPIQGSSADIIKQAMVNIHRAMLERSRHWKSKPLLQVHDELLFECPKAEATDFGQWARSEMETAVALRIPLVVDLKIGDNWQDMKRQERSA
jgi:DNA polymerase-1